MNTTSVEFTHWEYRNIALAVVTQCAVLVHKLAVEGNASTSKMRACLKPVYQLDVDSVADLYPTPGDFTEGMQVLQNSFDSKGLREHAEVVRYLLGVLVLQQHLSRAPAMMAEISQRINGFGQQSLHDLADSASLVQSDCGQLARLYQDTISKLSYRIHVAGNPEHLRNQQVADQIRALLLAGIRSAVLWHQLGGRRWHLFFYKKRIRDTLSSIRRKLIGSNPYQH
ncbi:MAG: high frequency lysogenization protein HflD [Gammaproteobacteria bacterium]|nr:high frequency lysogenization protein HflD [Gammaproteobacteria bacterium]